MVGRFNRMTTRRLLHRWRIKEHLDTNYGRLNHSSLELESSFLNSRSVHDATDLPKIIIV